MSLNETDYVDSLWDLADDAAAFDIVKNALLQDLPSEDQESLKANLWPWKLGKPGADLALGDVDDIAQAVFEFKRPATQGRIGSPVQWTPLKNIRGLDYSMDAVAEEIRVAYLDHSDPELDDYHLTQLDEWPWCYSCRNLKDDPNDETRHRPVMHQGDAYRLTLPGLGELNKPADFSQVRFIFDAPHENYITAWQDRLISGGD